MVNWTPFIVRFLGYRCKLLHVIDITIMHVSLSLSQTRSLSTVQFDGVLIVCNVFLDQKYKFQITRDSNIFLLEVPPSPWLSILRFNSSWFINAWTQIQILRWMIKQTGAECFFFCFSKGCKRFKCYIVCVDVNWCWYYLIKTHFALLFSLLSAMW